MSGEDDFTRRTLLANERTFLAWWRTGLTALTAALAAARVVPELADARHRWPYTIAGAVLAGLGTLCLAYGEARRRAVDRSVRAGTFADADQRITLALTLGGVAVGLGLIVLIVADA